MITIKVGNDRPVLQHTIRNKQSGDAIDLTGATVTPKCFFTGSGNEVTLTNAVVDVEYATGQVSFQFDTLDFDGSELGKVRFYYNVVFSDSDIMDTSEKAYKVIA